MYRLIKLSTHHYIIVEKKPVEEGEVGVYVYDTDYTPPITYRTDSQFFEIGKQAFKVTHSTHLSIFKGIDQLDMSDINSQIRQNGVEHLSEWEIDIQQGQVKVRQLKNLRDGETI